MMKKQTNLLKHIVSSIISSKNGLLFPVVKLSEAASVCRHTSLEVDCENAVAVSRLLSTLGEVHSALFLDNPDLGAQLANLLVICAKCPVRAVVEQTFCFWHELHLAAQGEDASQTVSSPHVMQIFGASLQELVRTMLKHAVFPCHVSSWDSEQLDQFYSFRVQLADFFLQEHSILGGSMLPIITSLTSDAISASICCCNQIPCSCGAAWRFAEGFMFCLGSISEGLELAEAKAILPQLFVWLQQLTTMAPSFLLSKGLLRTISQFSPWLSNSQEVLCFCVNFLLQSIQVNNELTNLAAETLLELTDRKENAKLLTSQLPTILQASNVAMQKAGNSSLATQFQLQLSLLQALCHIVVALDPEPSRQYVAVLISPLLSSLESTLVQGISNNSSLAMQHVVHLAHLLGAAFRIIDWEEASFSASSPHPLVPYFEKGVTLSFQALGAFNCINDVSKSVGQLIRNGLLSLRLQALPFIAQILEGLVGAVEKFVDSASLHTLAIAAAVFKPSKAALQCDTQVVTRITYCFSATTTRVSTIFSALISRPTFARDRPDVVKSFFTLAGQVTSYIKFCFSFQQVTGVSASSSLFLYSVLDNCVIYNSFY